MERSKVGLDRVTDRRTFLSNGGKLAALGATGLGFATRGFSTTPSSGAVSGSVLMWVYPLIGTGNDDQVMWNKIAQDFQNKHPQVKVTVQVQPWTDRVNKLVAAMAANRGPDVWYINPEDIVNHASHNRLVDVTHLYSGSDKADFYPAMFESLTWNNKLWAIPLLTDVNASLYNLSVFKKAGVTTYPTTWDELRAVAPKFKEAGFYLTQFSPASAQDQFYPYIWQAGGEIYSKNGKKTLLNSKEAIAAATFLNEMVQNKWCVLNTSTSAPLTQTPLGRQQVAMGINQAENSALTQLQQAWGADNVRLAPVMKDKAQKAIGTVGGIATASRAQSKAAAAAWVKYITTGSVLRQVDLKSSFFSPRKSQQTGMYDPSSLIGEAEKQLPLVHPTPANLYSRQISDDIGLAELGAMLAGQATPAQAMNAWASQANKLISTGQS